MSDIYHQKRINAIQACEIKVNKAYRQEMIATFAPQVVNICLDMQRIIEAQKVCGGSKESQAALDMGEKEIRDHFISMFGIDMVVNDNSSNEAIRR